MFRTILVITVLAIFSSEGLCLIPYIPPKNNTLRDKNGNKTGYVRVYSDKNAKQYDKYGNVQKIYKKSSTGRVTVYDKQGRRIGTYK